MRAAGLATATAPRNVDDDACIGASVPGVPFDNTAVAVVLNGLSSAREVEVIIPALGIGSQVKGAARRMR